MNNLFLNEFFNPDTWISFYKDELISENTHIIHDGKNIIDTDNILKDKYCLFPDKGEKNVPLPNEIYKAKIYKKTFISMQRHFDKILYNNKLYDVDKSEKYKYNLLYNKIKLKGIGTPILDTDTNITVKELYFISNTYLLTDANIAPICTINELYGSNYHNYCISFEIYYDYNNEHLESVTVDTAKFFNEYLNNTYYTENFRIYLQNNIDSLFDNNEFIKLLTTVYNWDEHQEYEQYEGHHLKSITLKTTALIELNKLIKQLFNNYTEPKHILNDIRNKLNTNLNNLTFKV